MRGDVFDEVVLATFDECKELLKTKGEDYSIDTDRLDNFNAGEQCTSLTKWQIWEALYFKHQQSIRRYFIGGRKELNEKIHHRIVDSINYLVLLEAMLQEEKGHGEGAPEEKQDKINQIKASRTYYCRSQSECDFISERKGFLSASLYDFYSYQGHIREAPRINSGIS